MAPSEVAIIQIVEAIVSLLSVLSSCWMAYKISTEKKWNLVNKMLTILFFIDFILGIFYGIGVVGTYIGWFCVFQGLIIQWFGLVAILWAVLMAYNLYVWVVRNKYLKKLEKAIWGYAIFAFVSTAIVSFVLLGIGYYGDAELWCWIAPDYKLARIICLDVPLIAGWIFVIFMMRETSIALSHTATSQDEIMSSTNTLESRILLLLSDNSHTEIQQKLFMYVIIFVITWFFTLLNRLLETGDIYSFPLQVLQVITLPSQGFLNALCYGGYLDNIFLVITKMNQNIDNKWSTRNEEEAESEHNLRQTVTSFVPWSVSRQISARTVPTVEVEVSSDELTKSNKLKIMNFQEKQLSIFVTTLNLGEAGLVGLMNDLSTWILLGHDIYSIGLQECIDLTGVREAIHNHLGGSEQYMMYTCDIGSGNRSLGYHGFIALTVYVKSSEVLSGCILPTQAASPTLSTGTDFLVTKAQNKGAVGIPLQIHDTSIGFVTAHLPSDSKGKSKLGKRNETAHKLLQDLVLAPEDSGFDLQFQLDHVVVLGDLNYRMETNGGSGVNGVSTLTGVAVASLIEKNAMQEDYQWLNRKYNLLRHRDDPLFPGLDELRTLKDAKFRAKGAWGSVLRADELRIVMDECDAFYGFDEPMPCFPPSYKRKKGIIEGDCGDYTDPVTMIQGYSNTGEMESDQLLKRPESLRVSKKRQRKTVKDTEDSCSKGDERSRSPSRPPSSEVQLSLNENKPVETTAVHANGMIQEGDQPVDPPPNATIDENNPTEFSLKSESYETEGDAEERTDLSDLDEEKKKNLRDRTLTLTSLAKEALRQQLLDLQNEEEEDDDASEGFSIQDDASVQDPSSPRRVDQVINIKLVDPPIDAEKVGMTEDSTPINNSVLPASEGIQHESVPPLILHETLPPTTIQTASQNISNPPIFEYSEPLNTKAIFPNHDQADTSLLTETSAGSSSKKKNFQSKFKRISRAKKRRAILSKSLSASIPSKEEKPVDKKKVRPPSYTDRILVHSLKDRRDRITIQAYDACDSVRCSDHRPVSMTILLEVNGAVMYATHALEAVRKWNQTVKQTKKSLFRNSDVIQTDGAVRSPLPVLVSTPNPFNTTKGPDRFSIYRSLQEPTFELFELVITEIEIGIINFRSETQQENEMDQDGVDLDGYNNNSPTNLSIIDLIGNNFRTVRRPSQVSNRSSIHSQRNSISSLYSVESNETKPEEEASSRLSSFLKTLQSVSIRNTVTEGKSRSPMKRNSLTEMIMNPIFRRSSLVMKGEDDVPVNLNDRDVVESNKSIEIVTRKPIKDELSAVNGMDSKYHHPFLNDLNTNQPTVRSTIDVSNHRKFIQNESSSPDEMDLNIQDDLYVRSGSFSGSPGNVLKFKTGVQAIIAINKMKKLSNTLRDNDDRLIRNMSKTSMNWQSAADELDSMDSNQSSGKVNGVDNSLHGSTSSSQSGKPQDHSSTHETSSLTMQEKRLSSVRLRTKYQNKKNDKERREVSIDHITIVFPLPSKDPLLAYRKLYDFSSGLNLQSHHRHHASQSNYDADTMSPYHDVEKNLKVPKKVSSSLNAAAGHDLKRQLLQPSSHFVWKNIKINNQNNSDASSSFAAKTNVKMQRSNQNFKMRGCVSPELGAYVLIKVTNKNQHDIGSGLICLSHLLNRDHHAKYNSTFHSVPILSGGRKKGEMSGKISLRFIPSPLSIHPPVSSMLMSDT